MKIKYSIAIAGYTSWCGLGFIRGINSYKYQNENQKNEPYLYSDSVLRGFFGIFVYGNPVFILPLLHKELYRLEVNVRNLENEKKTRFYNELF